MIIADLKIAKVDHNDPRYPGPDSIKRGGTVIPFSDVYLCSVTTDGGQPFECPYYVNQNRIVDDDMTLRRTADMLRVMAAAIEKMDSEKVAA